MSFRPSREGRNGGIAFYVFVAFGRQRENLNAVILNKFGEDSKVCSGRRQVLTDGHVLKNIHISNYYLTE